MNCFCNLFNNEVVWLIIIALLILNNTCNGGCGNDCGRIGCGECGGNIPSYSGGCGCGCN